jgi:hypothetical protein
MCLCSVSIVLYLRSRTFSRAVGLSGGVPITLLTFNAPDVSRFRVFRRTIFAKVHDNLRRKLREKAFRGVMVGYPLYALGQRVYNLDTRHITTLVHMVLKEDVLGFGVSTIIDSLISEASDENGDHSNAPRSHPLELDTPGCVEHGGRPHTPPPVPLNPLRQLGHTPIDLPSYLCHRVL